MDFSTSSHLRHWLFTPEQLQAHRLHALEACADTAEGERGSGSSPLPNPFGTTHGDAVGEEPSTSAPNSDAKRQRGSKQGSSGLPVSLDEQLLLLRFFESKIGAICAELKLPKKVKATALIYFKRFYVHHCCLDNDPARIMLTCIYLAAKIEESYISAEEFCRAARQDASVVLKGEVNVLQALHFDLVVHSPYRALVGLIKSIEAAKAAAAAEPLEGTNTPPTMDDTLLAAPPDTIQHCKLSAQHALDTLMLTDAPLLYTPSQMALAALRSGCSSKGIKLHRFVRHVACEAAVRTLEAEQQQQQQQQQSEKQAEGQQGTALQQQQQQQQQQQHAPSGAAAAEAEVAAAVSQLLAVMSQIDQLGMQRAVKHVDQQTEKVQVADIDRRIKLWKSRDPMANTQSEEYKQAQQAGERDKAAKREAKLRARQESRAQEEARLLGIPAGMQPAP